MISNFEHLDLEDDGEIKLELVDKLEIAKSINDQQVVA